MTNENMKTENSKKPSRPGYKIIAGLFVLLIIVGLIISFLRWDPEGDPENDKLIRNAVAKELNKAPNDLTDEDFAQFDFLIISEKSTSYVSSDWMPLVIRVKKLSDLYFLNKSTNLKRLSLINITPQPPKWMIVLEKIGIKISNKNPSIDFGPLENLTNFKQLNIDNSPISTLKSIRKLKNLEVISTTYSQISDLSQFRGMKNLKELVLFHAPVSDLNPIKDLVNLETLDVCGTSVSNLKPVQNLTNLKILAFSNTKVSNLEPVQNLKKLKELAMLKTPVSDFELLKELKSLEKLYLNGTAISNLEPLKELKNLELLYIEDCKNITDKQVEDLQKALPDLLIRR